MMLCLCLVALGIFGLNAQPVKDHRVRRMFPHQAMMISGFYGQPSHVPQGAMTAFATGDTVATNSYAGRQQPFLEEEEQDFEVQPNLEENSEAEAEEAELEVSTQKATRVPKRKVKPTTPADEDEEEDAWPVRGLRKDLGFNAFFPIIFGGRGASSRSSDDGYPGAATAIANSFSTGKGGVASSHATAFSDPYLSTLLRNGDFRKNKLHPKKQD